MPYYRCRGWIHSVSASPGIYQMEKPQSIRLTSFSMFKGYYINMSWIQTRNSWPLSYQKLGGTQYSWKHIKNLVTKGTTSTHCLIKQQYSWKGMNKDIRIYIANCTLCHREKAKVQSYPWQMTEIPEQPFDKTAIDLVTDCETSTSGKSIFSPSSIVSQDGQKPSPYWTSQWTL